MDLVITYTTTDNQKLRLISDKYDTHTFKDNVGYVTLKDKHYIDDVFSSKKTLKSVVIPNGLFEIGCYAFRRCRCLTSIVIPNSVTCIGSSAFFGCTSLTNVKIPKTVKIIGDWAFADCTSLTNIEIPYSITNIGPDSFYFPCNKIDRSKRPILAYKGFKEDMTCRGFKYEFGKSYHEDIACTCERGFHACLNPLEVLYYYPKCSGNRYALVEVSGDIDFRKLDDAYNDSKIAATDIKIVKELTFEGLINEFNRINNN